MPRNPPGHFPKKGERLVDGEWVMPAPLRTRRTMTAQDRVDWLRKRAGWPPLHRKRALITDE